METNKVDTGWKGLENSTTLGNLYLIRKWTTRKFGRWMITLGSWQKQNPNKIQVFIRVRMSGVAKVKRKKRDVESP
jgi:hypothetical protein